MEFYQLNFNMDLKILKSKFSFCSENKQTESYPLSSLSSSLLWDSETKLKEPEAQWLPFRDWSGWKRQLLISVSELCIFIFLSCSALENSSNECGNSSSLCIAWGFALRVLCVEPALIKSGKTPSPNLNWHLYIEAFNITHKIFKSLSKESLQSLTMNKNDFRYHLYCTF